MSGLRDQLETIRVAHGELTPALVVDAARPKDHPLHNRFEWDNRVAGEEWRRHQARNLIRSVRVPYADEGTADERSVRQYVAVRRDTTYEPIEEVAENPFSRELLLRQAERDWRALKAQYGHLVEFFELVAGDLAAAS